LRIQRQSEGIKKGENLPHKQAIQFVIKWFYDNNPGSKLIADIVWRENYSHEFVVNNKMRESGYHNFAHQCDLVFVDFETTEEAKIVKRDPKIFIEIDGERHSSAEVKIQDGLFNKWIEEKYNLPVYRIPKCIFENTTEDLTNEELSTIYLREFRKEKEDKDKK